MSEEIIDAIAEKLGIASSEVASSLQWLVPQYATSKMVECIPWLVIGVILTALSAKYLIVRHKQSVVRHKQSGFGGKYGLFGLYNTGKDVLMAVILVLAVMALAISASNMLAWMISPYGRFAEEIMNALQWAGR